MANCAGK